MTENKAPKIRFKGFTDDWELRKLGEMAEEFKSGINIKADNIYKVGDFPVYGGNGIRGYTDTYNHDGDFALVGRQGALSGNTNFSSGKAYFTEHAVAVKANKENDTKFLFYLMSKLKLGGWVTQSAQPGLAVSTIVEIKPFVPNKTEQRQISSFLTTIDDTIALHQRRLELFKKLKQEYLQKMLPRNGEKIPKIRFANFNDNWELSKLGDIVQIVMGQSPNGKNYTENPNDHILVQGNADMKNGRVIPRAWTTQVTKTANIGDIILSVRAPVGDVGKTDYNVVLGRGVAGIRGSEFIYQILSKLKSDGYWIRYSTGSTFESINSNDLKEAMVSIPKEAEQNQIGSFFKRLDDTIVLHQKKVDQLSILKKQLLSILFI